MSFMKAMGEGNHTYTENGALTNKSTKSAIVDLFFHGAALRSEQNEVRIARLFANALEEDPTTALRILFYIRDIRGGQGERRVFRIILKYLAHEQINWLIDNLDLIPEYGRWDDLFTLLFVDPKLDRQVLRHIKIQLDSDRFILMGGGTNISLLGKWLPSENTSSKATRDLASYIRKSLSMTSRQYRKLLSQLRATIKIVETNLTTKDYTFDYSQVPSNASLKYRKAFLRNDKERYSSYLEAVNKGEKKINVSTLYPYDLLHNLWHGDNSTVDTMWKNLPDYVEDLQGLVVADTSGSMSGRPMEVSVSLAMYIAERNKNKAFKDYFISFSEKPKFHLIKGKTLSERARSVQLGDVDNTNIQAVFDLILARAKEYNVPEEDMPKILLIISDMEFDSCARNDRGRCFTNFEEIRHKYDHFGYNLPTLIFWNVNSRNTQSPVTIRDNGTVLVSGCSPVTLKYALGKCTNVLDMVYNVTNSPRYNQIVFEE